MWLILVGTLGCSHQLEQERDQLAGQVTILKDRVAEVEAERNALRIDLDALLRRVERETDRRHARDAADARQKLELGHDDSITATLVTDHGDIPCDLWPDRAPQAVVNFVGLAEGKRSWTDPTTGRTRTDPLFDSTIFHRVIPGFMVQGGDPLGTGAGGPGFTFPDEISGTFDRPGLLAMANAGPNTNGSQFFITVRPAPELNSKHTIFGECKSLDPVKMMMDEPLAPRGAEQSRPVTPAVLNSIRIRRGSF